MPPSDDRVTCSAPPGNHNQSVSPRIKNDSGRDDRLPWLVYAIPIVLLALLVVFAIVASWIPAT
jgi:hypothetical protein